MHTYQVNLEWLEGKKGELMSPELNTKIAIATPPPFSGGVEGIWSPEHLLTAAVNSCFMTTFLAIAENSKLEFKKFSCTSEGILDQVEEKYLMTEVILKPHVELVNEADREKAERILQKSEKACLISNSIKSKVTLVTSIEA